MHVEAGPSSAMCVGVRAPSVKHVCSIKSNQSIANSASAHVRSHNALARAHVAFSQ